MFRSLLARTAGVSASPSVASPLVLRAFLTHSASATGSFALRTPFVTHLTDGPAVTEVSATKEELLTYFRTMTVWRRFAIAADQLYKDRKIRGFLHLADGQEAVYQGIEAGIKKTDSIITAYRCHLPAMARGSATLSQVFAELMGKATGPSGGKGGSMHIAYRGDTRFYGGNGIVGAQVPVGAGVAMAHKYRGDGGVCVAMYGDGASNQGQIYEAANMAQLWKLPCLFVCENNLYGMGTSTQRASGHLEFYKRGLNIPGIQIDGFDVLAVKEGFRWAADYARAGNGPMFIEVRTYRYHGHSMSDPGVSYRSRDEVAEMRQTRDCVLGVRNRLLEAGWATEADFKAIDRDARAEIQNAIQFAESSPYPAPEELYSHIQVGAPPPLIRTVEFEKSIVN